MGSGTFNASFSLSGTVPDSSHTVGLPGLSICVLVVLGLQRQVNVGKATCQINALGVVQSNDEGR